MTATRALFPLDGSDATFRAVESGLKRLAQLKEAEATFLVVLDKNLRKMPKDAVEYLEFDDEDELFIRDDEAKAVLEKAQAIAKRLKFGRVKPKMVEGKALDSILIEARGHDVLVMHGLEEDEHGEFSRGGFAERLVRRSPIDVWLIPKTRPPT